LLPLDRLPAARTRGLADPSGAGAPEVPAAGSPRQIRGVRASRWGEPPISFKVLGGRGPASPRGDDFSTGPRAGRASHLVELDRRPSDAHAPACVAQVPGTIFLATHPPRPHRARGARRPAAPGRGAGPFWMRDDAWRRGPPARNARAAQTSCQLRAGSMRRARACASVRARRARRPEPAAGWPRIDIHAGGTSSNGHLPTRRSFASPGRSPDVERGRFKLVFLGAIRWAAEGLRSGLLLRKAEDAERRNSRAVNLLFCFRARMSEAARGRPYGFFSKVRAGGNTRRTAAGRYVPRPIRGADDGADRRRGLPISQMSADELGARRGWAAGSGRLEKGRGCRGFFSDPFRAAPPMGASPARAGVFRLRAPRGCARGATPPRQG